MYNPNSLEEFFKKVHKEASEAAQAVYDKYNEELIQKVKNQMGVGHTVVTGMGTAFVKGTQDDDKVSEGEFFSLLKMNAEYHDNVEAGFCLPPEIKK